MKMIFLQEQIFYVSLDLKLFFSSTKVENEELKLDELGELGANEVRLYDKVFAD